jgi:hypothetical protein
MRKRNARALHLETLEGRCLLNASPAAAPSFHDDSVGEFALVVVVVANPAGQVVQESVFWGPISLADSSGMDSPRESTNSFDSRSFDDEGDQGQGTFASGSCDGQTTCPPEGNFDQSASTEDGYVSQPASDGATDNSGQIPVTPAPTPDKPVSSAPPGQTVTPPPAIHTGGTSVTSHSATPPAQTESAHTSTESSRATEPASAPAAPPDQANAQDSESEPATSLASTGGSRQIIQTRSASTTGAVVLPVDAVMAQTLRVAGPDEHLAAQGALPVAPVSPLNRQDNRHASDEPIATVSIGPDQSARFIEGQSPAAGTADGPTVTAESASMAEAVLPVQATLLTDILPMDLTGLESSMRAFFDQLDGFGTTVAEHRIDLLFTTGVLVATSAVALEVARRQLKPATKRVALGRDSIPYSDGM